VPDRLVSDATRLWDMNTALADDTAEDDEPDAVRKRAVEEAAAHFDRALALADTKTARAVPGASPRGGRVRRSGGSAAARSSDAGLSQLLGHLVEAVRSGVESYNRVVSMLSACVARANRIFRMAFLLLSGRKKPLRRNRTPIESE
jgi:hypothetical protein